MTGITRVARALAVASDDLAGARRVARSFEDLAEDELDGLLWSEDAQERLVAVLVLEAQHRSGDQRTQGRALEQFLRAARAERLDAPALVDEAAEQIVGEWFAERSRGPLFALVKSDIVWERRIALVATLAFVKRGDVTTTLDLAERLARERSDVIQEPLARVLREVAKRVPGHDFTAFLDRNGPRMPRATLAAAIEHLEPAARARYRPLF